MCLPQLVIYLIYPKGLRQTPDNVLEFAAFSCGEINCGYKSKSLSTSNEDKIGIMMMTVWDSRWMCVTCMILCCSAIQQKEMPSLKMIKHVSQVIAESKLFIDKVSSRNVTAVLLEVTLKELCSVWVNQFPSVPAVKYHSHFINSPPLYSKYVFMQLSLLQLQLSINVAPHKIRLHFAFCKWNTSQMAPLQQVSDHKDYWSSSRWQ